MTNPAYVGLLRQFTHLTLTVSTRANIFWQMAVKHLNLTKSAYFDNILTNGIKHVKEGAPFSSLHKGVNIASGDPVPFAD